MPRGSHTSHYGDPRILLKKIRNPDGFFLTNANVSRSKTRQLFDRNYLTYSTWTSQRHYDMKVHDLNGINYNTWNCKMWFAIKQWKWPVFFAVLIRRKTCSSFQFFFLRFRFSPIWWVMTPCVNVILFICRQTHLGKRPWNATPQYSNSTKRYLTQCLSSSQSVLTS